MDIPVIARMSNFEASLTSFDLISHRLLSIFELPSSGLWKWGAVLLALIYAFRIVARRIKIFVLTLHGRAAKLVSSSEPLLAGDIEFVSSDDEDEDDVESSCSSEDEREMRDDPASSSCENLGGFIEDFRVKGSAKRKFKIRRNRSLSGNSMLSLSDLVNGESVVKFWDGLGIELQLDGSSPSISVLDLEKNTKIGSTPGRIPAGSVSPSSPTMVFTASADGDGRVGLRLWDVRLRRRTPAVQAEWSVTAAGPAVRVKAGGVDKVYVRDDVDGNLKVWDVRKAKSPLTEYDGETSWDANAVSQTEKQIA